MPWTGLVAITGRIERGVSRGMRLIADARKTIPLCATAGSFKVLILRIIPSLVNDPPSQSVKQLSLYIKQS